MKSWLNQGRLRRPGRGLKSKRIRQQTIQKNASHTKFLTLPVPPARAALSFWCKASIKYWQDGPVLC